MKQFTKHPKGAQSADECQKWIDYDMEHYGRISEQTMKDIKKAGFTVTKDQYGDYEVTASCGVKADASMTERYYGSSGRELYKYFGEDSEKEQAISELAAATCARRDMLSSRSFKHMMELRGYPDVTDEDYQTYLDYWDTHVDYSNKPNRRIEADTVKKGNKWVNRGDTGEEHGEFETKKEADAQRRAMYAGGYKGPVKGAKDKDEDKIYDQVNGYLAKVFRKYGLVPEEINEFGDITERMVQAILKNI